MQRRNKVGGIVDRRFGENDPTMAPEDKMLERFAREKQRRHKNSSMFDLEDDEPVEGLTHMGKTITFDDDEAPVDDFDEEDLDADYDSDGSVRERQRRKRLHDMMAQGQQDQEQPERKRTKKEIMEEVIAKSKMHKMERQAAKEEDADLRAELDKELADIQHLLRASAQHTKPEQKPEASGATIAGIQRNDFDKSFDAQVKRLAQDRRAQPADRTKTAEEVAEERAKKLEELEDKRQRRMRGESISDSDEDGDLTGNGGKQPDDLNKMAASDDEDEFGLGNGIKTRPKASDLGFDDEDDFIIEDDLVASGTDLELSEIDLDRDSENESASGEEVEDDEEFTRGLLDCEGPNNPEFEAELSAEVLTSQKADKQGLPFTFTCPQSCEEFVSMTEPYSKDHLPVIVQRIRALHHPRLESGNKERLGQFATVLVDFISLPLDEEASAPISVLESLVRHIHSLAKTFPMEIAKRFRHHIAEIGHSRPLELQPSDLLLLTAAGTIFPTSDHFHQVVTPAMLTMTRYLGQRVPRNLADYAVGTYLSFILLQYQQQSKRYVPEVVNFCLNTLCALSPVSPAHATGNFPEHEAPVGTRAHGCNEVAVRKLSFADCVVSEGGEVGGKTKVASKTEATVKAKANALKVALLDTNVQVLEAAADLWTGKSAFVETFEQGWRVLKHLGKKTNRTQLPTNLCERVEKLSAKLERMLRLAQISRRPLELHHHRPLAIKTYVPKFEETFDPDKHYDPDRERAELAKLKAEYKKERKGALRELRKDARFMAREKLRMKKAQDEAYEKKFKRIVAEIQSEEGREANSYEREKKARKRARNRG